MGVTLIPVLLLTSCGDDADDGASDVTTTTGSTPADASPSLEGSLWLFASVEDGPTATTTVAGTNPTLQFLADNRFSANTGCNMLNGTYETSGEDGLRLVGGPMTQRACADEAAQQQELAITQGFDAVRSMARDGGRLQLRDDSGATVLTYAAGSTDLANTTWTVTGVNTGNAVESSTLTESLTLELGADGAASGNAGCNTFRAGYTLDGDQLSFDAIATTKKACEPDVTAMEQAYVAALGRVTTVRRTGTSVDLLDDSGAMQVTLVPPSP